MAMPREAWGWWGEEGGHRLDVKRVEGNKVVFTVTSATQPEVAVTLANFRVGQLLDWLKEEETQ